MEPRKRWFERHKEIAVALISVAGGVLVGAFANCGEKKLCTPNEVRPCNAPSGHPGSQVCVGNGLGLTPCTEYPSDAASETDASVSAARTYKAKDFGTVLTENKPGFAVPINFANGTRYRLLARGTVKTDHPVPGDAPYSIALRIESTDGCKSEQQEKVRGPASGYEFSIPVLNCTKGSAMSNAQLIAVTCSDSAPHQNCILDPEFEIIAAPE